MSFVYVILIYIHFTKGVFEKCVILTGTLDQHLMATYTMTTLDTLFIQKQHRGQGWGSSAVKDLLLEFPDENIGFSFPISIPMNKGEFVIVLSCIMV